MKDSLKIGQGIIIGVLGLALCAFCAFLALGAGGVAFLDALIAPGQGPVSPIQATRSPLPVGSEVTHEDFTVALVEYEFSAAYKDEYDIPETPPEGAKFLWIHIVVRNIGQNAAISPSSSDFSVVYLREQIDVDFVFASRAGYDEYDGGQLFPGVVREGWLRFTLPRAAEPSQLTVVFKPFQVFGDDYYSWQLAP